MAQGAVKASSRPTAAKSKHSKKQASRVSKQPKKGKPAGAVSGGNAASEKARRKLTAGMAAKTEAMLGERVGHLELIGGKRKKGDKREAKKGGSKKFG